MKIYKVKQRFDSEKLDLSVSTKSQQLLRFPSIDNLVLVTHSALQHRPAKIPAVHLQLWRRPGSLIYKRW